MDGYSRAFEQCWTGAVYIEKPGVVLVMRNQHNRRKRSEQAVLTEDVSYFKCSQGRKWTLAKLRRMSGGRVDFVRVDIFHNSFVDGLVEAGEQLGHGFVWAAE